MSVRRQKAEGRRQKAEGRRQETGGRRQEAGGRGQEAGGRRGASHFGKNITQQTIQQGFQLSLRRQLAEMGCSRQKPRLLR